MSTPPSRLFIISLLGALSVISPFAIDMYLSAFAEVAHDLAVQPAAISLTLSSYFIGLAIGQLIYGPLLDRYGRKKPLYAGLGLFIIASIGCAFAPTVEMLIGLRFVQALGGCVAGVGSLAMVRDFFPVSETAKMMSRLLLFIAVSPLLAPSFGGLVVEAFGWKAVFIVLAVIVGLILTLMHLLLPETHTPDTSISLRPGPILRNYAKILMHPRFRTYALSGAFSFAGLFTFVAGSPIIFMENFGLSPHVYSGIFALLAMGFIGGSQINVQLLKRYDSRWVFPRMLLIQMAVGWVLTLGTYAGLYGLYETLLLFFLFLSTVGMTYPNAAALAMAPFSKNTGSAAAMLGFLQLGVGAVISTGISRAAAHDSLPIITIFGVTSTIGFVILILGRKRAERVIPE